MIFLSLIPGLCWLLLFLLTYYRSTTSGVLTKIRTAALFSTLLHSFILLLITECLSAFTLLTFGAVVITWSAILFLLVLYTARLPRITSTAREICQGLAGIFRIGWLVWGILILLFISGIVAILYPINNYDSLTYHMARISHWIQNQSISYYPTHVIRQLVYQPFAEMQILHLQIVTGGDRLAQTVQTVFFAGCLLNVSLITKELGGNPRQQLFSSFFAALIPAVVLESNTTQNDIVVSYFVLAFVYCTLRITKTHTWSLLCWTGLSLGLALLTKGTTYLFAFPFILWLILSLLKDYRQPGKLFRKAVSYTLIPLLALLINSTFFYRNISLTGTPLGNANLGTNNEGYAIKSLLLVGLKDLMNHLPVTKAMKASMEKQVLHMGIDIDDPKYCLTSFKEMHGGFLFHDDYMKNTLHVVLIGLTIIAFFLKKKLYRSRPDQYTFFVFSLIASSILYFVLLKWQPWSNRLQAPLFLLYCVFLGMEIGKASRRIRLLCAIPIYSFAAAALLLSNRHPLVPVTHSIFAVPYNDMLYHKGMQQCKAYLDSTSIKKIGLLINSDDPDYLYLKLLRPLKDDSFRLIKHVFVTNESAIYQDNFEPDAIISMEGRRDKYILNNREYYQKVIFDGGPVIFEPAALTGQSDKLQLWKK